MAEIDKGLPNTRTKLDIPSEEEMAEEVSVQEEEEQQKGPIEVVPEEDGGATIDFEPGAINWCRITWTTKLQEKNGRTHTKLV